MPTGSKRGLVAPQNTFLESIIRKINQLENHCNFLLANSDLLDWPIVYVNDGFCNVTGNHRSEVVTQSSLCEFMHGPLTDLNTIQKMREEMVKKNSSNFDVLLYNKQGTPVWFLIQLYVVKNAVNHPIFFLLTFRDITVLKKPIESETKGGSKFNQFLNGFKQNKEASKENVIATVISDDPKKKTNGGNEVFCLNVLPKYHHVTPKTPQSIILHYSTFKSTFDWLILLLTFYTAIIVPYNVTFQQMRSTEQIHVWLISDSIVDLIFIVDIIINFHTTFVGPGGEVISEPKLIRMNYIKSWFVIDLLSCLPYDFVNFFFSHTEGEFDEGISSLFSSLKVVRLLRLGRVARKLDHYIEYGGAMLVLLVCFFGLSGHWFACIWYAIGLSQIMKDGALIKYNWLVLLGEKLQKRYFIKNGILAGGPAPRECYIASLYFTMTSLTSVGFGNIAPATEAEQVFCVILLIFGALLYATIFGNVTNIIQKMYADTNRYHAMLKSVREFMKLYHIPDGLSDRIMDYIISSWSLSKGIDTEMVLNYCPKDMKADICVHLNRKVFNKHAVFRLASDSCLRALAVEFTTTHNAPGDMIYHQGESVDALNFVVSGSLEIIQDDEVVAILSKGDIFGDSVWLNNSTGPSYFHVRALTYCDLHSIKDDALKRIFAFYQPFCTAFSKKMILTFNLRKRLLFRKICNVEREREETVRRENDGDLKNILSEEHVVRKQFKKLKKKYRERRSKVRNFENLSQNVKRRVSIVSSTKSSCGYQQHSAVTSPKRRGSQSSTQTKVDSQSASLITNYEKESVEGSTRALHLMVQQNAIGIARIEKLLANIETFLIAQESDGNSSNDTSIVVR